MRDKGVALLLTYICIFISGFSWVSKLLWHCISLHPSTFVVARDWRRALSIHVKYTVQNVSFRLYDPIPGISDHIGICNVDTWFHIDLSFLLYKTSHGIPHPHPSPTKYIYNISNHCASAVNHIVNALQFGKYSIGVYLDFSKASDTLNHDILFRKLNHYGIRGIALNWIKSSMVNRKQYIMYDDNSSDIQSLTWGVPQGSIFSPLLFSLYVNDLPNVSDILFTIMFADDTSMFINGDDLFKCWKIMLRCF